MGILYIVATPIGNLEDITIRAIKTLLRANVILCEDTRRSGNLLSELRKRYPEFDSGRLPKLMPYYDEIESKVLPEVVGILETQDVVLVSDAGTPLISDPGFRLVRECTRRGIKVVSIPGPSAVLTALTSSGLPTDKFIFLGYPPEKQTARTEAFKEVPKGITTIFYCAPHKLAQTLEDMKNSFGDMDITIVRELTKIHEEMWRGTISQALSFFSNPQGEFVLLLNLR